MDRSNALHRVIGDRSHTAIDTKLEINSMRLLSLVLFAALSIAAAPRSQSNFEGFEGVIPGSYASFAGFTAPGGIGGFSRIGTLGLLLVDNGALFPPQTGTNAMFGRGVDVQFRLNSPRKQFFGRFRALTFVNPPPNTMRIRFYLTNFTWTPWLPLAINPAGYVSGYWNVGNMFNQGYWAAQMAGNGGLPGYVGMDHLWVF